MNVSSRTGSPGLSRTKSTEPKTVVCVSTTGKQNAAIMLMIKTYRLNKTIEIHNAYVSVITCVRMHLLHSSMASSIACCGTADHTSTNYCFSSLMSLTGDLYCTHVPSATPRPCNQLSSDLDCWEATDLDQ